MRTKEEIKELMDELKENIEKIQENPNKWADKDVPLAMIQEKQTRLHTLEWVLGQHDRFD